MSGFEPRTVVTFECEATDEAGYDYTGSWSLRTDESGVATLANADFTNNAPESNWYGSKRGRRLAGRSAVSMILHRLSFESFFASSPNFFMGDRNSVTLSFHARSGLFGTSTPSRS
ncbi:hypothetical protein BG842_25680 [Haladaptatus sp. W1]|uniref:hypothetical protein n=1 Tax=Haladaptatus sp. W1 TaxID=1897478 RepID=UPI0008499A93|nr:hypothetical protein [Haladaptatus sp. W1]ODR80643.1 hypothetical protein BG842_03770 [Haladaptatus sp. W1]ODR81860.1 hypothetical protein BG842_25670 [Haladaptatus sp. W1]ODR81862.1 hypothetical protein BG842_25680 [Haladaptatus sp. W1]